MHLLLIFISLLLAYGLRILSQFISKISAKMGLIFIFICLSYFNFIDDLYCYYLYGLSRRNVGNKS